MRPGTLARYRDQLSDRDEAVLASLERFRLLTTRQIQRLHFTNHDSPLAAARACNRALLRLRDLGLITSLERRIGGVRKGSASFVWQLAATGENYQRTITGQTRRRRYVEPGRTFLDHTLAVNEVAVGVLEAARSSDRLSVEVLGTEPGNWRRYLGPAGETCWLKPDLHLVASTREPDGEYEEHAFLEIDLGTEHVPRIQAKRRMYQAYAATGAYQAAHGLFPAVVWLSPDPARRAALRAAVAALSPHTGYDAGLEAGTDRGMFRVASPEAYSRSLIGD